jgi:periplasmic protein TonB
MTPYTRDTQLFTRRSVVLFAIIGLHLFIAWALATGLARRAIELVAPPIKTEIIEEVPKRDEPPPPPPPQLEHPPVEVPPPDVDIQLPVEPQSTAIADVTDKPVSTAPPPPPAPPPPAPRPVNRQGGGPGTGFPSAEDYYPLASKRFNEEGYVTVHVCVGPNGKLTEDPTVAQTSGTARLDEGAIKLAKAGSGHYRPTTEDGQPVNSCFPFRIKFALRK